MADTIDTLALLERAGAALGGLGIKALSPTVPTTASLSPGANSDFMDRKQVEKLVDLTVSRSAWLSAATLRIRDQRKGEIPRLQINDVVTEGVPENDNGTVSTHPDTSSIDYNCKKFKSTWFITREDVREARASGEADFDGKVQRAFAKAMGNDMARVALNGDTTLDASTRMNRLLRQQDGWLKKIRDSSGNVFSTTRGSAYAQAVHFAMLGRMPEEYRDDANLRWFMSSLIDLGWTRDLADRSATVGAALGDRATIERRRFEPLGVPQLLTPQMPTNLGFAALNGSAVDPDGIVDDGDGTLTATVDTLLGGAAAGNAGRRIKITFSGNGQSETLTVTWTGANNVIATAGSLGQGTISTTAGDYALDVADTTPMLLCNPANLFVVICDQVRAYRKFEQEAERWRIDVYWEADFGVFNDDALVLQDGIVTPSFTWGS